MIPIHEMDLDSIFTGWKRGNVWYIYGKTIGDKTYIAHIGGPDIAHLGVAFSIRGGGVLDKTFWDKHALVEYLSELG